MRLNTDYFILHVIAVFFLIFGLTFTGDDFSAGTFLLSFAIPLFILAQIWPKNMTVDGEVVVIMPTKWWI